MIELSADEARRIAIWSQGLSGARRRTVGAMLEHLGAVQLDTISVLARSHELVAYARMGAILRQTIERAYWSGSTAFEYWSHAACILPMSEWPWFAFRRRHYERRGIRWHDVSRRQVNLIVKRLRSEGPLTTREVGGAKKSSEWWDWSESKVAIEFLLDTGVVVCSRREGWRRVYDLAERVVPDDLRFDASDSECLRRLTALGGHSVGVGTIGDIADVHRLKVGDVKAHIADTDLVEVAVRGWGERAWAAPEALAWLEAGSRLRSRTTLLSPFDSLIWHRGRMERLFGMEHRIEAYTPAAQRVHGYFAMPVLHGGRLIARVDPARERLGKGRQVLVARTVTFEGAPRASALAGVAGALREAATWVGADEVRVETVRPAGVATALRASLRPCASRSSPHVVPVASAVFPRLGSGHDSRRRHRLHGLSAGRRRGASGNPRRSRAGDHRQRLLPRDR